MIVWITGAPGAGKSTTAVHFSRIMGDCPIFDGDDLRFWLTPDCDFSGEGRKKHAERTYRVAKLCSSAVVAMVANPPGSVDLLVLVEGPARKPLWEGTTYVPPNNPDLVVRT